MIQDSDFKQSCATLLAEIFGVSDDPNVYLLDDPKAGLLGTLDRLDAATASARLRPQNETVASHTNHVLFLVDLTNRYDRGEQPQADWAGSWTNQVVDEATWDRLRAELRAAYDLLQANLQQRAEWPPMAVSAYILVTAHCAYHLGEIKQILTSLAK